jgi:hypothetical protein
MVRDRRWFPHVLRGLLVLAVVNAAVFVKLTPGWPARPTSQIGAEEFIVAHTRVGERMCLGPPFTLVAAKSELPGGRVPVFVVPTALYLRDFDEPAFLASIRTNSTVYIGSPEEYTGVQRHYRPSSPPVFPDAEVEEYEFEGRRVIVARPRLP